MQLTTREIELLNTWRRSCVYASKRSTHAVFSPLSRISLKYNAVNKERIVLIDKILKESA